MVRKKESSFAWSSLLSRIEDLPKISESVRSVVNDILVPGIRRCRYDKQSNGKIRVSTMDPSD